MKWDMGEIRYRLESSGDRIQKLPLGSERWRCGNYVCIDRKASIARERERESDMFLEPGFCEVRRDCVDDGLGIVNLLSIDRSIGVDGFSEKPGLRALLGLPAMVIWIFPLLSIRTALLRNTACVVHLENVRVVDRLPSP